jgi:hypothetical protein
MRKAGSLLNYLTPEEWQRAMAEGGQEPLPPVGEPSTLTGAGIRGITLPVVSIVRLSGPGGYFLARPASP